MSLERSGTEDQYSTPTRFPAPNSFSLDDPAGVRHFHRRQSFLLDMEAACRRESKYLQELVPFVCSLPTNSRIHCQLNWEASRWPIRVDTSVVATPMTLPPSAYNPRSGGESGNKRLMQYRGRGRPLLALPTAIVLLFERSTRTIKCSEFVFGRSKMWVMMRLWPLPQFSSGPETSDASVFLERESFGFSI